MWRGGCVPSELAHRPRSSTDGKPNDFNSELGVDLTTWLGSPPCAAGYVARELEPYRGFHIFMRAAREILRRRPKTRILVVGGDGVSYGAPPPQGTPEMVLREIPNLSSIKRNLEKIQLELKNTTSTLIHLRKDITNLNTNLSSLQFNFSSSLARTAPSMPAPSASNAASTRSPA